MFSKFLTLEMGCRSGKLKARPRVSRPLLSITPSKLPNIPLSDLDVMRAVIQVSIYEIVVVHFFHRET